MSFLDEFEDVFTEPEDTVAAPASNSPKTTVDYFDREDEPVIW